ncbi:hypothetical protein ELS24_10235 [Achromobacter spanius]|uniref:hypothetical protein n=1 Tax=Achromobacter spanius TaxID=217203 RepID=UPI000F8F9B52|nr:hypothetical protein [Achromobacter spanius]AZS78788.1 hypothetical protein ELS24_10235 [Achromobacter spanius]
MTIESQAAPVEAAQIPSTDPATITPAQAEPENPEGTADQQKPELTQAEREARALKRRVDRLTREKYQTQAELQQLRQRPAEPQADASQLTEQEINRRAVQVAEAKAVNDRCNEIARVGAKEFPDFMDKFAELSADIPTFTKDGPTPFMEAILDSDSPAALLHHIASNPDLADELADLSPRQQVRRLALIERDMGAKEAPPKTSSAPKPIQPVKPTATAGGPDPGKDPEGWIAWRNAQVRTK